MDTPASMNSSYRLLISICLLVVNSHLLNADVVRTVGFYGHSAPGTNAFFNFANSFGLSLNNSGQTAFLTSIHGSQVTSDNDYGIWSDRSGSLELIVREGSQAPGTASGVNFKGLSYLSFNNKGKIAFQSDLVGAGVDANNDQGMWSDATSSLSLVVREGQQAPGTSSGVNFSGEAIVTRFNDNGQTVFFHNLTGSMNRLGIWSQGSGSLSLVARNGNPDPATGDPFGFTNYDFEGMDFNNLGQAAFTENFSGSWTSKIWLDDRGNLNLIAASGSSAPGVEAGVNFAVFSPPRLNDIGQVAFRAGISGPGINSTNSKGIWTNREGSFLPVVRTGSAAPGTAVGVTFSDLAEYPLINDQGHVAFNARLTGTGITSSNSEGLWSDVSGSLMLVARTGNPAPGLGPGINFEDIYSNAILNNAGDLAFLAQLTKSNPQYPSDTDSSIWVKGRDGTLRLIAREGGQLDVDNGSGIDLRTISGLSDFSLNDVGQVGFYARFTSGAGVFVSNAAASADFDGDGDVDGRDFLTWQRGGSPGAFSAGNLDLWQEQYGMVNGSLVATQIPEPTTICVFAIFAITLTLGRPTTHCSR